MDKKILILGFVIVLLILAFFFVPLPNGLTGYSTVQKIPFLEVEISNMESHYEKFPHCYSIIEGRIINKRNTVAENVLISCSILDINDEELGRTVGKLKILEGSDTLPFSITVDLKCVPAVSGQRYQCNIDCDNCR